MRRLATRPSGPSTTRNASGSVRTVWISISAVPSSSLPRYARWSVTTRVSSGAPDCFSTSAACASSSTTLFFSMRSAPGNAWASASRWLRNTSAVAGAATARSTASASSARLERIPEPHGHLVRRSGVAHRVVVPILELQHHVRMRVEVHAAGVEPVRLVPIGVEAARHVELRVDVLDAPERLELVRLGAEQQRVDVVRELAVAAEHLVGDRAFEVGIRREHVGELARVRQAGEREQTARAQRAVPVLRVALEDPEPRVGDFAARHLDVLPRVADVDGAAEQE